MFRRKVDLLMGFYDADNLVSNVLNSISERFDNEDPAICCFTAWDITRELREEDPMTNISHRDVKTIVHTLYRTDRLPMDYMRSSIVIPGGNPPQAWLYHPDDIDPYDYLVSCGMVSDAFVGDPDDTIDSCCCGDAVKFDTSCSSGGIVYTTDAVKITATILDDLEIESPSRFCVPATHTRAIGLNSGNKAYMYNSDKNSDLLISRHKPDLEEWTEYTVDHSGNIRIRPGTLKLFGHSMASEVSVSGGTICITKDIY